MIRRIPAVVPAPPGKLARGGPFGGGLAVEIAAGTGLLTSLIEQVWPDVISADLSRGMLARSPGRHRIQADAVCLPLASGCAGAVVIGDGPLFAAETARIMANGAVLVWSNALGQDAPFYVPAEVLTDAMAAATGWPWDAVESQAHWGSWAVLRCSPGFPPGSDRSDGPTLPVSSPSGLAAPCVPARSRMVAACRAPALARRERVGRRGRRTSVSSGTSSASRPKSIPMPARVRATSMRQYSAIPAELCSAIASQTSCTAGMLRPEPETKPQTR